MQWIWLYVDPDSGQFVALPDIFSSDDRTIQVQTDDVVEDVGVYQFYVKGGISIIYMFPEKKYEEYITIEVKNPCEETEINSDNGL